MTLRIFIILAVFLFGNNCSKPENSVLDDKENVNDNGSKNNSEDDKDSEISDTYSVDYEWGQLKIGGGGYVTGIVVHPMDKNIMYLRTDVGGAYKWDADHNKWVQMLEWIGPEKANLIGVDGLAIDPNNNDRVYLALGKGINSPGGIFRSDNRGKTWEKLLSATYEGNGRRDRWTGECIAVDPNNSNIIYAGTRTDGLWRSTDDGINWLRVDGVPNGSTDENPIGIRSVLFDGETVENGESADVYVGVPGLGIFKSNDRGHDFKLMTNSPEHPNRMQIVDGELFVTHSKGVSTWNGGQWMDITPSSGKGKNYVAIAVDFNDNEKIVIAQRYGEFFNPIYRTENKGESWEELRTNSNPVNLYIDVPWWNKTRFSSATASMTFVPNSYGELYYTDWFGIWYTPDVWSSPTDWYTVQDGHEETVIVTLIAPPDGALAYSGMADNFGFRHQSLAEYPKKILYDHESNEGFSIAFSEKSPSILAVLGSRQWDGTSTRLAVSSDFGENWTDRSLPSGSTLGRISISSISPDNLVYVAGGGGVYYSLDGGINWKPSQGAPLNAVKKTDIWNKQFVLAADSENANFYLFANGHFYVSTNNGKSWGIINTNNVLPTNSNVTYVAPVPGRANEVWISLENDGLFKSDNGGKTFEKINDILSSFSFSWGASAPGVEYPTAYCYGRTKDGWGLYRSVNKGRTWKRINENDQQFMGTAKIIAADRNEFGQIYIGTGGYGVLYGKLR